MLKVVCGLIIKEGKILLTQLGSQSDHPFKWEFPGGKVNPGETLQNAIIREIKEELGIEIRVVAELDSEIYDYGFKQIELIPFICNPGQSVPHLFEHINLDWLTMEDLKKADLAEADKRIAGNKKNLEKLFEYMRDNMDDRG